MDQHFNWNEIDIDEAKKKQSLLNISLAVTEKKTVFTPTIFALFRNQLHYISWQYWVVQLSFMILALSSLEISKYLGTDAHGIINTATLIVTSLGVIGMNELNKSISCNMMELEQTCYFSSKQLLCIKMILFGSVDLVFLTALILMNHGSESLITFGLYIIVPFIISNICYLTILIITRGTNPAYTYFLAGIFTGAFALMVMSLPGICTAANQGIWFMVLLISIIGLGLEIRLILSKLEEREVLCTNYR